MVKKWYVVIVGKAVGVFSNWLEVAPLVTGVSGAQHQSFPTEEEALRAFMDGCATGKVKMVNSGSAVHPKSSCGSCQELPSAPSTPRRSHSHTIVSATQSPNNRPVRRANSDLSYVDYSFRLEDGRQGRLASSPRNTSPRYAPSVEYAASVRTPSGLGSYPSMLELDPSSSPAKSNRSLTPLCSPKISFGLDADTPSRRSQSRIHSPISSTQRYNKTDESAMVCKDCAEKISHRRCLHCNRVMNGERSPGKSHSDAFTDMHVSHQTLYDERLDPRSPVVKKAYFPLTGRPSPVYNEGGSNDFSLPTVSGSHLLSESPLVLQSGSSYSNTDTGTDDLSLSELSIIDGSSSLFSKPFTLLAGPTTPEKPASDGDTAGNEALPLSPEPKRQLVGKQREEKLRSDLFILKKLNSTFALIREALEESGSANERVASQLKQTDALLNKYIGILSESEEYSRLILDAQWMGADADEEQLQRERREALEMARREAEERAVAEQREREQREREERERLEKEEKERMEREHQDRLAARGAVRGVRGTRASVRGVKSTSRAGPASSTSRLRAPSVGGSEVKRPTSSKTANSSLSTRATSRRT
ncbi:hypothetical protein APHAL10511_004912 [Amanita phalloides]|nr:hypothetical protein APHAL10511_004912 [Amanita phalloides]